MNYKKNKQGSTLLLGLLVMTVVFSSMYFLTNLAIRNINQTSATVAGEVAVLGADAAVEQGLWSHARRVSQNLNTNQYEGDCDAQQPTYASDNLPNTLSGVTIQHCKSLLLSNPAVISVPVDNSGTPNIDEGYKEVYLADLTDLSLPGGYTSLNFQWVAGVGDVRICDWGATICDSSASTIYNIRINPGTPSGGHTFNGLSPANKYILSFETVSGSPYFSVRVTAAPKALPADYVTVKGRGLDPSAARLLEANIAP